MNSHWSRVVGGASGVVFVVLIFLSLSVVDPLREATDADLVAWWSEKANLDSLVVSMYTRLLAIPFFLAFLAQLASRLRASGTSESSIFASIALGVLVAAMIALAGLTRGITALSVNLNDEPLPGVDVLRFTTELAYQAYAIAVIGGWAVLVGVLSSLILSSKSLPSWLGWLGVPVAVSSLIAVPLQAGAWMSPLLIIWILAASICLIFRREDAKERQLESRSRGTVPEAS